MTHPNPKDPQAELREAILSIPIDRHKDGSPMYLEDVFSNVAEPDFADQILALFQTHQQQLLTELEDHAVLLSEERADGKHIFPAVPVEAIQRLQNKTNDGGRNGGL